MKHFNYLIGLIIAVFFELVMYFYIDKKSGKRRHLVYAFKSSIYCMVLWCVALIVQILMINYTDINPLYADFVVYIAIAFLPISFFFIAYSFSHNDFEFKKWFLLLGIVPTLTVLILWTNNIHHLFYEVYSINPSGTVFGPYFYIHSVYTYGLFVVDIIMMMKNSVKMSGAFSKQSLFIILGSLVPLIINLSGMTIFKMNIYVTPISFVFSVFFFTIAILKYNFLDLAPIALQRIVNQMSDSYLVINKYGEISDCNKAFENVFKVKKEDIVGKNFKTIKFNNVLSIKNKNINSYIENAQKNDKIYKIDAKLKDESIYFNIEVSGIFANNQCLGVLILFKDITQHIIDMQNLKNNQSVLMEKERLATLGQMIGGVAHNLKTPIMSISGATEGLEDLIVEYDNSIGDPDVTGEDHHAIAKDMLNWIVKIRSYDNYMSDIITAVKGQAVNMNESQHETFTIEELLSRVNILMKHELKEALVTINEDIQISKNTEISGNVNSLVQVVNNLISNAIQSYGPVDPMQKSTASGSSFIQGNGSDIASSKDIGQKISKVNTEKTIDLIISEKNDSIVISVTDHGCGMTDEVKNKLFKEMITTKGHNGSGLGLFMSYSTIKGNFQGDMNFTSKVGKGTTFNITLPRK